MKAFLMRATRDFDVRAPTVRNADVLTQDLELETLFGAMSGGDPLVHEVARRALLLDATEDQDDLRYRQRVLRDCLDNPSVVRGLYALARDALEAKRSRYLSRLARYPSSVLYEAIEAMRSLVESLRRLRKIGEREGARFHSEGFGRFFEMVRRELGDDYLAEISDHLGRLRFPQGVLLSAGVGTGNRSCAYVLRKPAGAKESWLDRLLRRGPPAYTYRLPERDEAGAQILSNMHGEAINSVANALAQSTDHVLAFFEALRVELAFFVGCLNLRDKLDGLHAPICIPSVERPSSEGHRATGLYDVCLALELGRRIVGNTLQSDGKALTVITGANQGGKSSFLRAVGVAQIMMQAGMFVGAESFAAAPCSSLHTHYKREEDRGMTSGKLDEELRRMSAIADALRPRSIVLFNESFASTNEREGAEIARQVVRALVEAGARVFFVSHQYEFARGFVGDPRVAFLRAERAADGTRTYELMAEPPLATSYGVDLYERVFGSDSDDVGASSRISAIGR